MTAARGYLLQTIPASWPRMGRHTRLSFTAAAGSRDRVSFPTRDGNAGRSRPRIRERFNFRAGGSDAGASTSALLLLLLTRFSRELLLLSCLLIVRLRHDVLVPRTPTIGAGERNRIRELAQVRRSRRASFARTKIIGVAVSACQTRLPTHESMRLPARFDR